MFGTAPMYIRAISHVNDVPAVPGRVLLDRMETAPYVMRDML
jgi:hypothetical protein